MPGPYNNIWEGGLGGGLVEKPPPMLGVWFLITCETGTLAQRAGPSGASLVRL